MDSGVILSTAAVCVSALALGVSGLLGLRQANLLSRSSHISAVVDLLTELRSVEFHDDYNYVVAKLRSAHDPALGISGLPEPSRAAVLSIAYYYQAFAFLIGLGVLDEAKVLPLVRTSLTSTWEAIQPYVMVERNRVPLFLFALETLASYASQMPKRYSRRKSFQNNWHRELMQEWYRLR